MANISNIEDYRKKGWFKAPGKCLACDYEAMMVTPIGSVFNECPTCKTFHMIPKNEMEPNEGTPRLECDSCGSHYFYVTPGENSDYSFGCGFCGKSFE